MIWNQLHEQLFLREYIGRCKAKTQIEEVFNAKSQKLTF